MTMVWDLFGIDANNNVPDPDGCIWTVASSEGWGAPDQRTQFGPRTGRDGVTVFNRYADGRPVVLRGLVFAPNDGAAWSAYDRVNGSMPGLRGEGDITAFEPVPKVLTVVQAAAPIISKPLNGQLSYSLSVVARYPWKRALAATTFAVGAGATVAHTGTGTVAAEIEVTTTSGGTVDLTNGGMRLRTGTLPSGSVLTSGPGFTNPKRTIRGPSGENLFGLTVSPMQWPAVVPGSNSFHQAGTAGLSIRYFPTYA